MSSIEMTIEFLRRTGLRPDVDTAAHIRRVEHATRRRLRVIPLRPGERWRGLAVAATRVANEER